MFAKQIQYEGSLHRNGTTYARATSASCAGCHSHEGFMDRLANGNAEASSVGFAEATPVNCRTCHEIHTTFTSADYALTQTAAVTLIDGNGTVDFGTGNLCASCHQNRALSPVPVLGGADVVVTSSRYGYHHGPQANVLGAKGAFAFTGSKFVPPSPNAHGRVSTNPDGCVTCHMATSVLDQRGGHTFAVTYEVDGVKTANVAGCNSAGCHEGEVANFGWQDVQEEVETMLAELQVELRRLGIMRATSNYANAGTFKADIAAGFVNWQMFEEDRSMGVHSPKYALAVLTNTIEKMKTY